MIATQESHMRKSIEMASEKTGTAKFDGLVVMIILTLMVAVMALSIPVTASSLKPHDGGQRSLSTIPMTCENAANVKLLQTLMDHSNRVWTVAFSPDGRLLASCGQDGKVLVRNVDSLAVSRQMGGFPYWVVGLAFSPDGRFLAYGGAMGFSSTVGPIGIWNVEADSLERSWSAHTGGCWSLDFQESTGTLVSGSFDNTVKLWNPQTGALFNTLSSHTGAVLSVDFNPHQDLIASSGTDYTVRLWNSQTGSPVRILAGHTGNVGYVKFSPDGLKLASSADDGTVRLWNFADSSLIWPCNAGQGWVNCVNFNPDGSLMVTCGHDGSVVLRDAATGLELKRLTGHTAPVIRAAFNPAGTLLATAGWDNTIRIWGIERDTDPDGVPDVGDNCPLIPNPTQADADAFIRGDAIYIVSYIFRRGLPAACTAMATVSLIAV
jgi:WD40 repeat protein